MGPFGLFQQLGNRVIAVTSLEPERPRFDLEWFGRLRRSGGNDSQPQEAVHRALEGFTGAFALLFQQSGNVFINGESFSHIMMFS